MASRLDSGPPASARPTGTVAFLFTDIEGSTARWASHRAAMDVAVKRHEVLLRDAYRRHGGYVFKTVGDAFCVAFARASDAVSAAIEAQLALAKEDFSEVDGLRVRIGLHAGEASERDGDYFGPAVNFVSRLTGAGHGGQIVLSGTIRELIGNDLPSGASMVDLGFHRLKDLGGAQQLWQLSAQDLPVKFPPLRSLSALSSNLPIARTSFVGRECDLAQIEALLANHRLITLAGAGGVGKTRLAIHVGEEMADSYPDGVWFADFAPLADDGPVASVIAKVLGISLRRGQRLEESIARWLQRKKLLLILDNCEHVLGQVSTVADAILNAAPNIRLIATSRQALRIGGEKILRLASLGVPGEAAGLDAKAAMKFDAVVLFADRASLASNSFALTNDNAPLVARICRRLDGIPLAIELAAARVGALSLGNIVDRLNERFKILTAGTRTALPRQKTLRAMVDWSYDLLTEEERAFFGRLGIFSGSFDLESATEVCGRDGCDSLSVLDLLSSLTDKSLVVAEVGTERERYHLLESTRQYAQERLSTLERDRLARRHARYFRELAEAADKRYGGSTAAWLADVEPDLDNYRTALKWAITDGNDVPLGGVIAGALEQLWFRGGLAAEGIGWISRAQAGLDEAAQTLIAARMLRAVAFLCDGKERYDVGLRALELYQSAGDESGQAWALCFMGFGLHQMGRPEESADLYARALETMRRFGERWGAAVVLIRQATLCRDRGDLSAAREIYAEGLAEARALGNEASEAVVLSDLAELEFADGHAERALKHVSDALEIDRKGKNAIHLANEYTCSCVYRIALGSIDPAREDARGALGWARRAQNPLAIAIVLQYFALLASLRRKAGEAAQLLGYVDAQYKELGYQREITEEWAYEKLIVELQGQLSVSDRDRLATQGAMWSEERAFEEALLI
jgi:predicted ATPase/class 3 adenylate cyclase